MGRAQRPQFDKLCRAVAKRHCDIVCAWAVDRLSRSVADLVGFLNDVHAVGCDLYVHTSGVDTSTPGGRALFQVMGVFAELERNLIRERVISGLQRAREHGTRSGRAIGRPRVDGERLEQIKADLRSGLGIAAVAAKHQAGKGLIAAEARALVASGERPSRIVS
jgi:DNA invertase Pin-like site-specific DNA recombinase